MLERVISKAGILSRTFTSRLGKDIYYVTDKANWAFDNIAANIQRQLQRSYTRHFKICANPFGYRNQIIHYGNRYIYLAGQYKRLHPSNTVFLTWYHGDPGDPNPQIKKLLDSLSAAADRLEKIVVSCNISRKILSDLGIPRDKMVLIPIGVDTSLFRPYPAERRLALRRRLEIPDESFCIGSFQKDGQGWGEGDEPKPVKGPDVFLDVVGELCKRHKINVFLTGPSRGYVKRGLEKLGVPYHHIFCRDVAELADYYNVLDAYLITSRSEGGPMAFMESWASGVPVVSTEVGIPADYIINDKNGIMAAVDDVTSLAAGVESLIENQEKSAALVQSASQSVGEFDWSNIARAHYEQLYQPFLAPETM